MTDAESYCYQPIELVLLMETKQRFLRVASVDDMRLKSYYIIIKYVWCIIYIFWYGETVEMASRSKARAYLLAQLKKQKQEFLSWPVLLLFHSSVPINQLRFATNSRKKEEEGYEQKLNTPVTLLRHHPSRRRAHCLGASLVFLPLAYYT
jgi:hypothetical protein